MASVATRSARTTVPSAYSIGSLSRRAAVAAALLSGATVSLAAMVPSPVPALQTSQFDTDPGARAERANTHLDRLLAQSDLAAAASDEPAADRRTRLLARIAASQNCFVENPTPEQLALISEIYGGRNPVEKMGGIGNRFFLTGTEWDRNGQAIRSSVPGIGEAIPIDLLTYSFPADGVPWTTTQTAQANDLNANLDGRFGAAGRDYGYELFRQVLADWQRTCGVRYREVCDDNAPLDNAPPPISPVDGGRGDIRFGAHPQGRDIGILAANFFPEGGGDMILNSDYFTLNEYYSGGGSGGYKFLRRALSHEHGHGLGFRHVVPCSQTKLMEPFIWTGGPNNTIQIDERRGAQHAYGDRFAGNHTARTARELNERHIILPGQPPSDPRYPSTGTNYKIAVPLDRDEPTLGIQPHSVIERDLSTNGAWIDQLNPTGQDWFRFSLEGFQLVTVRVTQTGGLYSNGQQSLDPLNMNPCAGSGPVIDADRAGRLALQVFATDAAGDPVEPPVIVGEVPVDGPTPFMGESVLAAGTYLIRIFDRGPNPILDQPTQLYDLEVRMATEPMAPPTRDKVPPLAIAGVDKIARVDQLTQYIGDILSNVQQTATQSLVTASYEWDLDGDGLFETNILSLTMPPMGTPAINPRTPYITYTGPNRIVPVSLRVTDGNGLQSTDTIFVKVVGEPITITGVIPNNGLQGSQVDITINGSGLGAITNTNQIRFSGDGITVLGSPIPDLTGTVLTGLSLAIDPTATTGLRDVSIGDGCGPASMLVGGFEVLPSVAPPNNDECTSPLVWPPGIGCKPYANLGATTDLVPQDYTGTSCAGSTIENDVWYFWTVPSSGLMPPIPQLRVDPRPNGTNITRVAVYRDVGICPPTVMELIGCGSSLTGEFRVPSISGMALAPGERLLFRVGSAGMGQFGTGCVNLSFGDIIGACCDAAQACTILFRSACPRTSTFVPGGGCAPVSCSFTAGACCVNNGACGFTVQTGCPGTFLGTGTVCSPNPCGPVTGACCIGGGACSIRLPTACTGVFQGPGTVCGPNPCPAMAARCCFPNGNCQVLLQGDCAATTGTVFVAGQMTCTMPSPCVQPIAKCCRPDGTCTVITLAACALANGIYQETSSTCAVGPACATPRRCCLPSGGCALLTQAGCTAVSGVYTDAQTTCGTPSPCPQFSFRCCLPNGACVLNSINECSAVGGTHQAGNTSCTPVCPQPQARCCLPDLTCRRVTNAECTTLNGVFSVGISNCSTGNDRCMPVLISCCLPSAECRSLTSADCTTQGGTANATSCAPVNPCSVPTPGCCLPDGMCRTIAASACSAAGGTPSGGTACTPNPCPQPLGACCGLVTCTQQLLADCSGAGFTWAANTPCPPGSCREAGACCTGTQCAFVTPTACISPALFQGPGTTCGTAPNPTTCCPANVNLADGVTVQDIFDYLPLFLAADPRAEFDGTPGIAVGDLFAFLRAWFNGCGTPSNPTGSCCTSTTMCAVVEQPACTGTFSLGQACDNAPGNPITCCPANFNRNDGVTVQDIFDFLLAYFNNDPSADFNRDTIVAVQDIFDFLSVYFAGCS